MADSINIGNITVDKFYLGSSDDVQIYLGSTKLYPQATPQYQYFTIRSLADNNTITLTSVSRAGATSFSYSTDSGTTWNSFLLSNGATETITTLASGDTLMLKGSNITLGSNYSNGHYFRGTADYEVEGNVMSLLDDTSGNTLGGGSYNFAMLFSGDTHLVSAENLVMADNTTNNCYNGMFRSCTSLTKPPKVLSAETVYEGSYSSMFEGCTSLTEMPNINATTVNRQGMQRMFCMKRTGSTSCQLTTLKPLHVTSFVGTGDTYNANQQLYQMFMGNASLTTVPSNMLPATTLVAGCYYSMFYNCTSLTTAPELPATTLANNCYYSMFSNCTSLTTAPELHATTLAQYCYMNMFFGCSSLNSITCLATDISASHSTSNWVENVALSGTFTKAASMTGWESGTHGIPTYWTVIDYSG